MKHCVPAARFPHLFRMQTAIAVTLLLLNALFASRAVAAKDHLEFELELSATWETAAKTNHHHVTATCVVGTNDWFIAGNFLTNARVEYWLVGASIAERRTITSSIGRDDVSEKPGRGPRLGVAGFYLRKGEVFLRTHPWLQPFGYGDERIVWLAFCSGSYVARPERQIPMLIGSADGALGYSDKSTLLDGSLGLPNQVMLYARNGELVSQYEVLSTTNVLGRTYPIEFRCVQYGQPRQGRRFGASKSIVAGRVTSVRAVQAEPVPEDIFGELNSGHAH
jgi:hypothetical protein